jgi:hypothetical protein
VSGQAATTHEIVFDFLRDETDGSAQLDIGQSLLPQVKNSLEADMEILGDLLGCP